MGVTDDLGRVHRLSTPHQTKPIVADTVCVCVCVCSVMSDSCNPMDCSLPDFSVHGTLQARILEWVAMPSSRDLPDPGIEPASPALQVDPVSTEPPRKPSRHYRWSFGFSEKGYWTVSEESRWVFWLIHKWISSGWLYVYLPDQSGKFQTYNVARRPLECWTLPGPRRQYWLSVH